MKKVVFILGPTAVGKTKTGVNLAQKFGGEIVSADSVQIYRGLDIGSAKVTKDEMQGVVHHAIDILNPDEEFSVFEFVEYTKNKIDEIISRGKLPIVVGVTGLYIKALTLGYNFGGADKNKELREKYQKLAEEKGNDFLFDILKQKNSELAEKTDKFNTVRLIRALEIAENGGEKEVSQVDIKPLLIGLVREREGLYADINRRVDIMLKNGLLKEVEFLKNQGLTAQNHSMRAIGYKKVLGFIDGEYDYEKMVELVKQHSRNYAKRQLTFLRGMNDIHFVDVDKENSQQIIEKLVGDFLK